MGNRTWWSSGPMLTLLLGSLFMSSTGSSLQASSECTDTGTALNFDGVDDCFSIPYSGTFPTDVFSASAWVKLRQPGLDGAGAIVSRGEDESSDNAVWTLYEVAGRFSVQLEDDHDVDFLYESGTMIVDDQWHHLAATRSADGALSLYVDGSLVVTFSNTLVPSSANTQRMTIGCSLGSEAGPLMPQPPHNWIDGLEAEVTVWNKALTPSEIADLFKAPPSPSSTGLVGFWRLSEGAGQIGFDSSPAGNDGVLGFINGPETSDPAWATYIVGSVLLRVDPGLLSWYRVPSDSAVSYDVIRGDLNTLRTTAGDFSVATSECLVDNHSTVSFGYSVVPAASEGFWFLVRRVTTSGNGTYDSCYPSQVGARDSEIAASGVDCP